MAKEFANWVNHLMCSAQQLLLLLHCLGAEQSLIHNHRCIFTAAQEEPTARVLCTCNYANLSTPLVRSASALCTVFSWIALSGADAQRSVKCDAAAANSYIYTWRQPAMVFLMFALQPAAKFSPSREQWQILRWLSRSGCVQHNH